jgi:hypothetical protein
MAGRPKAARPTAGGSKAARPKAGAPKATRPKAGGPQAGRRNAGALSAGRPKAGRPKALASGPARPRAKLAAVCAPATKCKHVYAKRGGWEVRNKKLGSEGYGGFFKDHAAAKLRASELFELTDDQLRNTSRPAGHGRKARTSEKTIYKGILKVGSRYQVQLFGTYLGCRQTLEDALQLALAQNDTLTREDLMWDTSPVVDSRGPASSGMPVPVMFPCGPSSLSSVSSLSSLRSPSSLSSSTSPGARADDVGHSVAPSAGDGISSPRVRKRLQPLRSVNSSSSTGAGADDVGHSVAAPSAGDVIGSPRVRKRLRPAAVPATGPKPADLSKDAFREFFGCLWNVYGEPDEEFQPSDLADMVARLRGPH